ncbi:hypothetical protein AAKU55_003604 [Oxalobacteraceae bacterium GrIS 1.11]
MDWTEGYTSDFEYQAGFFREQSPVYLRAERRRTVPHRPAIQLFRFRLAIALRADRSSRFLSLS